VQPAQKSSADSDPAKTVIVYAEPPVINIPPIAVPAVNVPPANYHIYITIEGLGTTKTEGTVSTDGDTRVTLQAPGQTAAGSATAKNAADTAKSATGGTSAPALILHPTPQNRNEKTYSLQIGSFKTPALAKKAYDGLAGAGLRPVIEQAGDNLRVTVPGVQAGDVSAYRIAIKNAGFSDIWVREE
jgi:cell division protein FtsN